MTYESRLLAGILLIVLPTVMIGGVSILSLLIGDPAYMENPLRQNLWRAGHAHAGVWLILALVSLRYVDEADLSNVMKWLVRGSIPHRRHPGPGSFLPLRAVARCQDPQRAHLSRLCRRSAAGGRRARPRRRPGQASGMTIFGDLHIFTAQHTNTLKVIAYELIVASGEAASSPAGYLSLSISPWTSPSPRDRVLCSHQM
jgi:hypothetical protein